LESEIFHAFGVHSFGVFDIWWIVTLKRHTLTLYAFHRYHWFAGNFSLYVDCVQDIEKTIVLALVPPTLETFGIFHNDRVRYPHIYALATDIVEIHCIYTHNFIHLSRQHNYIYTVFHKKNNPVLNCL